MTEFKRAQPMPMPENWEELGEIYEKEREDYINSAEYAELDDPRAAKKIITNEHGGGYWEKPKEPVVPTMEECFSFFETVLATKSAAIAVFDPSTDTMDVAGSVERDYPRLFKIENFTACWIRTHTEYPIFTSKDIRYSLFFITDEALIRHIAGEDAEDCYSIMGAEWRGRMESLANILKQVGEV